MSRREVRLFLRASPVRARSLFTVRAAISSARLALVPRASSLFLMCSYCRSRVLLDPRGIGPPPCGLEQIPPLRVSPNHRVTPADPVPGRETPDEGAPAAGYPRPRRQGYPAG